MLFLSLLILPFTLGISHLAQAASSLERTLQLLHTNDLHSQVEGAGPDAAFTAKTGDHDPVLGHYARLLTLIRKKRAAAKAARLPVALMDAGDFFSGSLYHALGPRTDNDLSPEFEFFKLAQYDVVSLGNHEFDAGDAGTFTLLSKAKRLGFLSDQGPVVVSNWQRAKLKDRAQGSVDLQNFFETLPKKRILEYSWENPGGRPLRLRIGVLGGLGPDAARVSATKRRAISFLGYQDARSKEQLSELIEFLRSQARQLRTQDQVDLVVLAIHAGDPEDRQLAEALSPQNASVSTSREGAIDIIVGGHAHEAYFKPKRYKNTWVVQAGCYGKYLGELNLSLTWDTPEGRPRLISAQGELHPIDDATEAAPDYLERLKVYQAAIRAQIQALPFAPNQVITTVTEDHLRQAEPNNEMGIYTTSRIRTALNRRLATSPVDVYFTTLGLIREDLKRVGGQPTPYLFSDIFRILGTGFDDQLNPGMNVVGFYMKKEDLRTAMNFLEIYRHVSGNFTAAYSDSLKYRVRPWGIPFLGRLTELTLHGKPFEEWPALIKVGTNALVAEFFEKLPSMSFDLIHLSMRTPQGEPLLLAPREKVPTEAVLFAEALRAEAEINGSR